ncbi:MAG: YdcF family protein, partial [Candidatus Portnoybacteria bacterium]|nr:YdcF family protein [Candidatus Portnoybacteria bacterium]
MLSEREQFIILASSQRLQKADTIILLTGDSLVRVPKATKLFKEHWAPLIVISGNSFAPEYGSFEAKTYKEALVKEGI